MGCAFFVTSAFDGEVERDGDCPAPLNPLFCQSAFSAPPPLPQFALWLGSQGVDELFFGVAKAAVRAHRELHSQGNGGGGAGRAGGKPPPVTLAPTGKGKSKPCC